MSAVEEIQAAIEKLERLRDESASGSWLGWKQYNPLRGYLYGVEANGEEVAQTYLFADTELIEVLHRTIDAQLAILEVAVAYGELGEGQGSRFIMAAKTLARAINGGPS